MIVNAVLVLGTVTAAAVSLEPHFSSAYQLHFGLLAANLLPYLLYAAITACRRGTPIDVLGLVLVITHVGLLAWPGLIWEAHTAVFAVPLILSAIILPIVIYAAKPASLHNGTD